jgi:hypothetical protein
VDVFEKSPTSIFGRPPTPPQARLDAALDGEALAAALGPAALSPRPVATPPSAFVAPQWPRPIGLERARVILGDPLAALAENARWLEARALQVKGTLAAAVTRDARAVVGFRAAGGFLEEAARDAGAARALSRLVPGDLRASLERMTAARQRFVDVQQHTGDAEAALRDMAARARATPRALQDVREVERVAGEAREGVLPNRIAIPRYDPSTGQWVRTELYRPEDFLPRPRKP